MVRARITQHAIERYISRVEPSASPDRARACVEQIVIRGQVRSTPRHWMRHQVRITPGLRFVYWAEQPYVCALVLDGAVVTIVHRSLYCRRQGCEISELFGSAPDEVGGWGLPVGTGSAIELEEAA
jgi:hypothetical protein